MVARGKTEHGYFTDNYNPLPESRGSSQAPDGPPPSRESQAHTPLQPRSDEEAGPQARRMQKAQHHQTPPASKRQSGGGRTRLSSLSESAASREALEREGPGHSSQIRGAKQPSNTFLFQQANGREEEQTFHPPKKQRQALTVPSPIDNTPEQTINQEHEQPELASVLPRQRPIANVSEQAITREPEPLLRASQPLRRERPPDAAPTNPLADKPLPRSPADAIQPRAAVTGPRSRDPSIKDPLAPPVRKPGLNREKIRADTQLRLQNLELQSGQALGGREPTEALLAPRTGVRERPGRQGSRPGVSPEELMRLRERIETNLQNLERKKGPKQERESG